MMTHRCHRPAGVSRHQHSKRSVTCARRHFMGSGTLGESRLDEEDGVTRVRSSEIRFVDPEQNFVELGAEHAPHVFRY